jgi:hypothetical protein
MQQRSSLNVSLDYIYMYQGWVHFSGSLCTPWWDISVHVWTSPTSLWKTEGRTLAQVTHKLLCWLCYVNDTFVTWPQKPEKLVRFLHHQNCLHRNIQFSMEMERDSHLPFLDKDIYRSLDGTLSQVYWTPTNTNLCPNPGSDHHPSNIQAILATLVQCVTRKATMMSWSSSRPLSGKTSIVSSRYDVPSTRWWEPQGPNRRPPHSLSCLMSKQNTAALAECWPAASIPWRTTWDWGLQGYTAPL